MRSMVKLAHAPLNRNQPTHRQKSQGFRSGDRGGQAVGKLRLIILSSPKCRFNSYFTGVAMCGGAPSCIKIVLSTHPRCCRAGMSWFRKRDSQHVSLSVEVTGLEGPISSKKKGPTINPHHTVTF
ncbi:hypothetical protein AVEN_62901-1 [Araneus ventricosus]|uniref:Uncharacterized protein n=1 Tax=Araneus ventricosus TaxID=182803 RepID=A0A4Y2R2M8_ARAVE|nr:hypothetical protein AVEN_62901-1 [Araneus ventricosus]